MSLLMNALKKAEQAKQKGDDQNESSKMSADRKDATMETSIQEDTITETSQEQEREVLSERISETPENLDFEDFDEVSLTLDEIIVEPESSTQLDSPSPATELAMEAQETTEHEELAIEDSLPDESSIDLDAPSQQDSTSNDLEVSIQLPESEEVEAEAEADYNFWPGLEDEIDSESKDDELTEPADAELAIEESTHKEQETTVDAKSAPASDQNQARRKFALKSRRPLLGNSKMWLPAVTVFILLLLGAGAYYYFNNIVSGLSDSSIRMPPINGVEGENEDNIDVVTADTSQVDLDETQPEQSAQSIVHDNATTTDKIKSTHASVNLVVAQPMKQNMNVKPVLASTTEEMSEPVRMHAENQSEVVASNTTAIKPKIRIVRKQKADPKDQLLNKAYQAFKDGNDTQASAGYQAVLKKDGANRDALLGLAVIAHRNNNRGLASSYYASLLKLNPKDSVAISGLVALQSGSFSTENESRVKLLLDQEPDAAHLHFTLGTLYVSQSRWADAQQSFFNAHRYAPENSDYTYNLAVSLDRIGQKNTALNYYQLTLDLANGNQVMFNLSEVNERIKTLLNLSNPSQ